MRGKLGSLKTAQTSQVSVSRQFESHASHVKWRYLSGGTRCPSRVPLDCGGSSDASVALTGTRCLEMNPKVLQLSPQCSTDNSRGEATAPRETRKSGAEPKLGRQPLRVLRKHQEPWVGRAKETESCSGSCKST